MPAPSQPERQSGHVKVICRQAQTLRGPCLQSLPTDLSLVTGEKGLITKGVFSLEESLVSRKSLNSLESQQKWSDSPLFSTLGGSLESLESPKSLKSLEALKNIDIFHKDPFAKKGTFFRSQFPETSRL